MRWFGSLESPTAGEWVLGQRMLFDVQKRSSLLRVMDGNPGWFEKLRQVLSTWLAQEGALSDKGLAVYLASLADTAQAKLVSLLRVIPGAAPSGPNGFMGFSHMSDSGVQSKQWSGYFSKLPMHCHL